MIKSVKAIAEDIEKAELEEGARPKKLKKYIWEIFWPKGMIS